jgi:hypothetical protein
MAKREYRLAFLYGDTRALNDAHAFYDRPGDLLEIAPDTPAGLLAAGNLLRDRPEEAQEAWRRAWESFGEVRALALLATAKLATAHSDEALNLARLLQEANPRDAAGYVVAARALEAIGRGNEAFTELELGGGRPVAREPRSPRPARLAPSCSEAVLAGEGRF